MIDKAYFVVVLINILFACMNILTKDVFSRGMSTFVFVFYRQAISTVFLVPVAFLLERKKAPLSFLVLFKMFMLALIGITVTINLCNVALHYTSATAATATSNSIPVITFFLSALFGMEKLKITRLSGVVKLLGIGLCLGGVITMAFYKGPILNSHLLHMPLIMTERWIKGTFIMIIACITWSLWMVFQGRVLKEYPSQLMVAAMESLFSTFQTFCVTALIDRDLERWKLGFDMGLVAIAYSGVVVGGFSLYLQLWCIERKGPVFLAMSNPLNLIVTIILSFLLGKVVSLGSVLAGALMVGGLYSVLWGKSMEEKDDKESLTERLLIVSTSVEEP